MALHDNMPDDVKQAADGTFYRQVATVDEDKELSVIAYRVCEDCWQIIPPYVDFPRGLVSPDSDGDAGGNFIKSRLVPMDTNTPSMGVEHLQKVVCLPCYLAAFQRRHPGGKLPKLRPDVMKVPQPAVLTPRADDAFQPGA